MTQLNELYNDVNTKVIVEEARLMKRTNQVAGWMKRVEDRRPEMDRTILEGTQQLERCCPKNCWSSYKLVKKVVKMLLLVEELKHDGLFEIVAENPACPPVQGLAENFTIGLDSEFENASSLLWKDDIQFLGLYGVGGVGKTTLLKKINNEFQKRNNDFDVIIWVLVSSEVKMGTVQEAIRERLGLKSWSDSVPLSSRASDILNALKMKKFLILLDDVWEEIDLQSIEKCHGLPLALITVGASMAGKTNPCEWKHAISELNKSAAKFPGMEKRVLRLLKFSYDKLPSPIDQVCFLFCALYPEDSSISIKDLIEKWIGAGYIRDFVDFEGAFNMVHSIIGTLKRTCLLENGNNDEEVKMHDVIRELAL